MKDIVTFTAPKSVDRDGRPQDLGFWHIHLMGRHVGLLFGGYPVIQHPLSESDRKLVEVASAQFLGVDDTTSVGADTVTGDDHKNHAD